MFIKVLGSRIFLVNAMNFILLI
uniref:Uncharacterized protein n=1 Tax=Heterorhabditis bacteriophora TaxID=37862 RepID=A0A1I7XBW3_HETBA